MTDAAPRLLFVPVSGSYGMGEYARSLAIARAAARRWPAAAIHFLLSRAAPYAPDCPFPSTLLPASPTFHSAEVAACIAAFRPDVVVFDNAGRTAQLRAAAASGARVVFVSARRRQRGKAFRWRWMRLIDEHWIAYPQFIVGAPGAYARLKLRVLGRPRLRYLDVIMSRPPPHAAAPAGACADVLVVPGGGTGHPGAADAVAQFYAAARALAADGTTTSFVGPAPTDAVADTAPDAGSALRVYRSLPQARLAELMQGARLVIVNGGSTLLQAIACGRACLAAPIAADQRERIRHCIAAGVAVAAAADGADIAAKARTLLRDEAARGALAARAAALPLADGIEVALQGLSTLLNAG